MVKKMTKEPEPGQIAAQGFYSALMMPISIVAAIQTALLISLVQHTEANDGDWFWLVVSLVVLAYCFAGHAVETKIFTWRRVVAFFEKENAARFVFAVVVIVLVFVVAFQAWSYFDRMPNS